VTNMDQHQRHTFKLDNPSADFFLNFASSVFRHTSMMKESIFASMALVLRFGETSVKSWEVSLVIVIVFLPELMS
jgi:hypothetical protein